ncbi:hypothetical protein [Salinimonas chungwhensis]|uniref:hypothetical protein n=1 Tax=Salinimonas chungwhensis TaxID=265425 RepID=UPI0003632975|nr:hypothetical protein [Salinimonas chungwhensis]
MTDEKNNSWEKIQLTQGSDSGKYHSHAYYDIPVFDSTSRLLAGHSVSFKERRPTPEDKIDIGYIDLQGEKSWVKVGESTAWSWQQGAMSQWLPQTKTLIWNDREDGRFVSRHYSVDSGETKTFPHPVYAVDPDGKFFLSLNMARLDYVRPGYGYVGGKGHLIDSLKPKEDGVWIIDAETGEEKLLLSLHDAAKFLLSNLSIRQRLGNLVRRYVFWFNHVKISPDGKRFTVKLRFRSRDLSRSWNDSMGCSLTCGTDGSDLRLLEHATSHVIWLDEKRLYFWRSDNGLYLYEDAQGGGKKIKQIAPKLIDHNVHIRHFPHNPEQFIFDTPYRETIDLFTYNEPDKESTKIATFHNHNPKHGEYRCDLHPCPSPDGKSMVVTSMEDGGRQMYLLWKKD